MLLSRRRSREIQMQPSDEITFTMPADMSAALRASVEDGEYASTSEAIRDAIRVWQRQRVDDANRLAVIRARVRRSLDDPRPNLTLAEVDAHLDAAFVRAKAEEERMSANATATG